MTNYTPTMKDQFAGAKNEGTENVKSENGGLENAGLAGLEK